MSLSPRMNGGAKGLKSFRLSEVPYDIRVAAADALIDTVASVLKAAELTEIRSPVERADLMMAATFPSDELHWISRAGWEAVMSGRHDGTQEAA